jgi:hypothetical protein
MLGRMKHPLRGACVVCGSSDARSLSTTLLADGSEVRVCGSHALSHRRAGRAARSVSELVSLTRDRRRAGERRSPAEDGLAATLTEAFSPKAARGDDRRRSA